MNETRDRPSSKWLRWLPLVVLVLAVLAVVVYQQTGGFRGPREESPESVPPAVASEGSGTPVAPPSRTPLEEQWLEATGTEPVWPGDFDRPSDCGAVLVSLRALCERVDRRLEGGGAVPPGGSFELLTSAANDLAARPPVVEGELARHDTILANVAHLFRVLGERRVLALRAVLDQDDLVEPLALDLYRWALVRERCEDGQEPRGPGFDAQYEYAAFLIQTVGGQAYLRRRSPRIEALAGFYALQVLDRAVERGYNPHGVNLRPEILRVRQLLEGADGLVFRDRYLEITRAMERRWKQRTSLLPAGDVPL